MKVSHIYIYDHHYQSRKWMMITHVKCTILLIFHTHMAFAKVFLAKKSDERPTAKGGYPTFDLFDILVVGISQYLRDGPSLGTPKKCIGAMMMRQQQQLSRTVI